MKLYTGCYNRLASPAEGFTGEGISTLRWDAATGGMERLHRFSDIENPSFQAVSPSGRFLYSVSEYRESDRASDAKVAAFSIEADGSLRKLNVQTFPGSGSACHISCDPKGEFVAVASYLGGSVALFPTLPNGELREASSVMAHEGGSVHPTRQTAPHAHAIYPDAEGVFAFAPDLGADKVFVYKVDRDSWQLLPQRELDWSATPGSGPRHMSFHPSGRWAYVICELTAMVDLLSYDAGSGKLQGVARYSMHAPGYNGPHSSAHIQVHPGGRFLYASERGDSTISVYGIGEDGFLRLVQNSPSGGKEPRAFGLSPCGGYLVAANQHEGGLHSFRIDPETGKLSSTGNTLELRGGCCLTWGR